MTSDELRREADNIRTKVLRDLAGRIMLARELGEPVDCHQDLSVWIVEASDREVIDEYEKAGGDVERMRPRPR